MNIVAIYSDGGVIQRNPSPFGGTWAWCAVDSAGQRVKQDSGVIRCPTEHIHITNNMSEYAAAVRALEAMAPGWLGTLYSDSQITLGRLFWGWDTRGLLPSWITRGQAAVARLGTVTPVLLQGHPTRADLARGIGAKRGYPVSEHNVWCDKAATAAGVAYLAERQQLVGAAP